MLFSNWERFQKRYCKDEATFPCMYLYVAHAISGKEDCMPAHVLSLAVKHWQKTCQHEDDLCNRFLLTFLCSLSFLLSVSTLWYQIWLLPFLNACLDRECSSASPGRSLCEKVFYLLIDWVTEVLAAQREYYLRKPSLAGLMACDCGSYRSFSLGGWSL